VNLEGSHKEAENVGHPPWFTAIGVCPLTVFTRFKKPEATWNVIQTSQSMNPL
jgi:hypothetical protein